MSKTKKTMRIENKNYLNNFFFFIIFDFMFYYLVTLNVYFIKEIKISNFIFINFLIYYYLI